MTAAILYAKANQSFLMYEKTKKKSYKQIKIIPSKNEKDKKSI